MVAVSYDGLAVLVDGEVEMRTIDNAREERLTDERPRAAFVLGNTKLVVNATGTESHVRLIVLRTHLENSATIDTGHLGIARQQCCIEGGLFNPSHVVGFGDGDGVAQSLRLRQILDIVLNAGREVVHRGTAVLHSAVDSHLVAFVHGETGFQQRLHHRDRHGDFYLVRVGAGHNSGHGGYVVSRQVLRIIFLVEAKRQQLGIGNHLDRCRRGFWVIVVATGSEREHGHKGHGEQFP